MMANALVGLLVLAYACTSFAWGPAGHRLVGAIADSHLTPKAKAAVRDTMKGDSLADVANWMDEVRGTKEGKAMRPWHFDSVDVCKPSPATCADNKCASRQIELAIAKLKQGGTREQMLKALRVLVHLVGDIHQPLHTAENDDTGGNAVTISNRMCLDYETKEKEMCTLHKYWDSVLVTMMIGKTSASKFSADLSTMTVKTGSDARAWVVESNSIAKATVHNYSGFACKAGKQTISVNASYDKEAIVVVREQLAKAGQRLAAVLNGIYK